MYYKPTPEGSGLPTAYRTLYDKIIHIVRTFSNVLVIQSVLGTDVYEAWKYSDKVHGMDPRFWKHLC